MILGMKAGLPARAVLVSPWILGAFLATSALADTNDADSADANSNNTLVITAAQLDKARNAIQSDVGASSYAFSQQQLEAVPGGENASITDVLLRAPGVSQDSSGNGGIHVRNEHLDVQYRINGAVLPEGVSLFGQGLSPRFVNNLSLLTGALPAEFGLRTAGVIDIKTKSGVFDNGGVVGLYGGTNGTIHPSLDYGGSVGDVNFFVAGDELISDAGINNNTPSLKPIHDGTLQSHAFVYLDKILDDSSRITFIGGSFAGQFQIPNVAGQTPSYTINGNANFDSAKLREHNVEGSHFGVLSYLHTSDRLDFNAQAYAKYSLLHYHPDWQGDLAFGGAAQDSLRESVAVGLQTDAAYRLTDSHTLRGGFLVNRERASAKTVTSVEPAAGPDTPFTIGESQAKTGFTYSAYLQDEWSLTPRLTLNYGLRFDAVDAYTHESQVSPRINLVWKPFEQTTIHAGYANYFTPPPLELIPPSDIAIFAPTTGAFNGSLNGPVRAERSDYFDIGLTQTLFEGFNLGLDAYYKKARDLLDEGQFAAPTVLTPFNYHSGMNYGVEISTTYDSGPFSYYGNLAIADQHARGLISSQYLFADDAFSWLNSHFIHTDHDQVMEASAGVAYNWEGTRFGVDILAGSGLRRDDNHPLGGTVPSYEQINLSIDHKFTDIAGGPLEVRLDVVNLADEIYRLRSGATIGEFAPQYGPRRGFFAGVTKRF